jgi:hypothetical protein
LLLLLPFATARVAPLVALLGALLLLPLALASVALLLLLPFAAARVRALLLLPIALAGVAPVSAPAIALLLLPFATACVAPLLLVLAAVPVEIPGRDVWLRWRFRRAPASLLRRWLIRRTSQLRILAPVTLRLGLRLVLLLVLIVASLVVAAPAAPVVLVFRVAILPFVAAAAISAPLRVG